MNGRKFPRSLREAADQLSNADTTARNLVEEALSNIHRPDGEGARAFVELYEDEARRSADYWDGQRKAGRLPSPFAGAPISIKDLFDDAGHTTRAGSKVMSDNPVTGRTNIAVERLRKAGFIVMGRTNMTELAYSGLGMNPHFGTPLNPYDRETGRIPGGSSSGAVVSVTDDMALMGLGSDTGGSCRIPAALCGVVGFKPTQDKSLLADMVPLSPTLDTVGCMANSVECCRIATEFTTGKALTENAEAIGEIRLVVPESIVFDQVSDYVMACFDKAMKTLEIGGFSIRNAPTSLFANAGDLSSKGGFPAGEAYAHFAALLKERGEVFDPRVKSRIERGKAQDDTDRAMLKTARTRLIEDFNSLMTELNAVVYPTVPDTAPALSDLSDEEEYGRVNLLFLRNSTLINLVDGCAISIPIHEKGNAPVGLTIAMPRGQDARLIALAARAEAIVNGSSLPR
ncbi:amidase [Hoeflea sp. CAU 1731]